ncbi:hypothetical protein [Bradyrhizobium sp. SYSU BS000235]|uniref:hypothetical protein n=1 Tax=Bradyrhizobium sp. SYSU BS000235 TaxID=3411332 RepID=UPI003C71D59B
MSDIKRPDSSLEAQNAPDGRANLASLGARGHPSDPETEPLPLAPSPDELALSIQASVSEIAVVWMLHRWSLTQKMQSEPLHQQIRDFSPAAFNVIISRFPALKSAKQEHLWLIYFKGLLTAGTHPREEMTKAIQTVGAQDWIRVSPILPDAPAVEPAHIGPKPQSPRKDLSDADALEQIGRALGYSESQLN